MNHRVVLIPVYNEESHLSGLLHKLREVYQGDVLFVDDGSCDRSVEVLDAHGDSRIRVLRQPTNRGYGATLIRGFEEVQRCGYDFVVTMDSDGQHRPDWLEDFFRTVQDWDVVSGSRYLGNFAENQSAPADRQRINQHVTATINQITGFGLTDSFCGFKAYRVAALRMLELRESGYSMPLQFWIQAKHFGLRVTELPVSRIYDDPNRSFGAELDNPEVRLRYYLETIEKERARWKM
jgi:dolichol-phosphate mannosyltransferase